MTYKTVSVSEVSPKTSAPNTHPQNRREHSFGRGGQVRRAKTGARSPRELVGQPSAPDRNAQKQSESADARLARALKRGFEALDTRMLLDEDFDNQPFDSAELLGWGTEGRRREAPTSD